MLDGLTAGFFAGLLIGALALLLAGIPTLLLVRRQLWELHDRMLGLEDGLYRETKKRASAAGVAAREREVDLGAEAARILGQSPASMGPPAPGRSGPRLIGGRHGPA